MSKKTSPADGRRQPREAAAGPPGQPLVQRHVGVAAEHLQPGLLAQPGERRRGDPGHRDAPPARRRARRRAHARLLELDRLRARDPGDEREVVVLAAAVAAARPPVAVGAVLDGIRVRRRRALAVGLQRAEEAALHAVGVGLEVARAERARLVRAEHHVHALGREPCACADHRRVEQQLEDHVRLRVRRELGVGRLVGVGPELGRHADLEQEVRRAAPVAGREGGLVDHVGAAPASPRPSPRRRPRRARSRRRRGPRSRSALEVRALVLAAALGDQLGVRAGIRCSRISPRARARSSAVRCSQARKLLRSLGERRRRPPRCSIAGSTLRRRANAGSRRAGW